MVEIKGYFYEWQKVDKEYARRYIKFIYERMIAAPEEKRIEIINSKHLRGITFEELMKGTKGNEEENKTNKSVRRGIFVKVEKRKNSKRKMRNQKRFLFVKGIN